MNITEETIEKACKAFYNDPSGLTSWDRTVVVSPRMANRYREAMARALKAVTAPDMAVSPLGVAHLRTTAEKDIPNMPDSLKEARRAL